MLKQNVAHDSKLMFKLRYLFKDAVEVNEAAVINLYYYQVGAGVDVGFLHFRRFTLVAYSLTSRCVGGVVLVIVLAKIKSMILSGQMPVTDVEAVDLVSYQLQATLGDFDAEKHKGSSLGMLSTYLPPVLSKLTMNRNEAW